MGLAIYVNDKSVYSRSYGSFGRLRCAIAEAAGLHTYPHWYMQAILRNGNDLWPQVQKELKGHPLRMFLLHSDCDGIIGVNSAQKIKPVLESLVEKIDPDFKLELQYLIDGFEESIKNNAKLEFC